jgi:indole-3-glycerol phosphate synthase
MFENIPSEFIKISESGISKVDSIIKLIRVGYDGFLIGENFMKTSKPGESAYDFIKKVENEI